MRELKFRVWNKAAKSWLNDDAGTHCWSEYCLNIFTGEVVEIVTSDNKFFSRANEPNFYFDKNTHVKESPYVVQQYTGLKDKNGVEIYEGDIVKVYSEEFENENFTGKVIFDEGSFLTWINKNDIRGVWSGDDIEVVGNIMENPELLKQ
jgi:uncharacterized phage protein (TIGR01671 family)